MHVHVHVQAQARLQVQPSMVQPHRTMASFLQKQAPCVAHFLETLREKEAKRHQIKLASPQLKYRGTLIQVLRDISSKFSLGTRVLLLGVRILDLFMDSHDINLERIVQVALICLFIAAKFEIKGPQVKKFSEFCEASNTEELPQKMLYELEWMVLQHVNWNLCEPTAATFVEAFIPFGVTKRDYFAWCKSGNTQNISYECFEKWMKYKIKAFLDITLSDMRLCKVPPSLLGAACIQAARKLLGLEPWFEDFTDLTCHTLENTMILATRLERMMSASTNGKRKRHCSDSSDDQGYDTGKSTPDLKRYKSSDLSS